MLVIPAPHEILQLNKPVTVNIITAPQTNIDQYKNLLVVNNPVNSAPPVKYTTAPIVNPYGPAPYSNPQNNFGAPAPAPAPAPTSSSGNNRVS